MSKTYKKVVCFKDYSRHHTRWAKRQASKAVRKTFDIDSGKSYKKIFPTWSIFDYKSRFYSKHDVEENRGSGSIWEAPSYTNEEKAILFPYWYKKDFRA